MTYDSATRGIVVFRFPHLTRFDGLRHGIFSRHGGVSKTPFDSLNISHGLGDEDRHVTENRLRVARFFQSQTVVYIHQNHGTRVAEVKEGRGMIQRIEADAVITASSHHALAIQTADCQAILLYDPAQKAVANIHNGWRGSIGNIIGKTIERMSACFNSRPQDLWAGLGPSLGPCCAEFVNYKKELPPWMWRYKGEGRKFDFWQMSRDQLTAAGIPASNIAIGGQCTRCQSDIYYSYRGEKMTGRFASVVGLTP
jgi:YfiH family protein